MYVNRALLMMLVVLGACDTPAKDRLRALAHADSARTDSIVSLKNDLLSEVMSSSRFVNDVNAGMARLATRRLTTLSASTRGETGAAAVKDERAAVLASIRDLVTRLDASENRVAALRARAARLSRQDSSLVAQVTEYERTIAALRQTAVQQQSAYEADIARKNARIAQLASTVDTITSANVRLEGERTALADTVSALTTEKNAAYYVIGTQEELLAAGVLVEEGRKRFLVLGGRAVAPARDLDANKFTRIDRRRDRTINFPPGAYTIVTRQNPAFMSPFSTRGNTISGGIRIDQPERFWEPLRFLIIIRS